MLLPQLLYYSICDVIAFLSALAKFTRQLFYLLLCYVSLTHTSVVPNEAMMVSIPYWLEILV